jgi:uncharacterized protein YjbI with pentapeptide repeats
MAYDYRMRVRILGVVCVLVAVSEPVLAECFDVPAPGVYWRRCLQDSQNLREVDLRGATLRDSSFKRADLSGANLTGADARRAKFVSAILHEATFDDANLVQADLTKAQLQGASLRNVDLTRARLFRANLRGADLTGASLDGTDLLHADLSEAVWIDGVTICAEGSESQCNPGRTQREMSGAEASG